MANTRTASLQCPYCGEDIEVVVDCSVEHQQYVEDCGVCCQPINITAISDGKHLISLDGRSDND